jgi:serine/threonine protein kinase
VRQLLRSVSSSRNMVPLRLGVAIAIAVLDALAYAHDHEDEQGRLTQLVHRDITPRNVLLNRRGEVKLVDFGIARAQHQLHVTRTGTIKGTLPYMSPEQASGGALDRRSDLYSVGVLLYELLTSKGPFPEGPLNAPPPVASRIAKDIPTSLDRFLTRSMAFDRDDRYPSAAAQRDALLDALAPEVPATCAEIETWLRRYCIELVADDPGHVATEERSAGRSSIEEVPTVVQVPSKGSTSGAR